MLLPASASAQNAAHQGGLFGGGSFFDKIEGLFDSDNDFQYEEDAYGLFNQQPDRNGSGMELGGMTNDDPNAPLGSGLLIMAAAGAGYALLKKKEEKA